MNIIGDVSGKHCLMVDDMIDTAGSCTEGAKALLAKYELDAEGIYKKVKAFMA